MSSYQGLLWPIRPKPLVGEVLSSWVSRTGAVADVSLQEFLRQRLPKKAGNRFDLDKIEQPDFYEALAAGAGVTVEEARSTSYLSDEGLVYARRTFNNLEWIAPLTVAGRRGRHYSIPFCPSCLAEDSEPFYRKRWRYAFAPLCPKHACRMIVGQSCQSWRFERAATSDSQETFDISTALRWVQSCLRDR